MLTTNPEGLSLIPQNTHSGNRDLALESCPLTSNMEGMVYGGGAFLKTKKKPSGIENELVLS